jgi:hypothetical protein
MSKAKAPRQHCNKWKLLDDIFYIRSNIYHPLLASLHIRELAIDSNMVPRHSRQPQNERPLSLPPCCCTVLNGIAWDAVGPHRKSGVVDWHLWFAYPAGVSSKVVLIRPNYSKRQLQPSQEERFPQNRPKQGLTPCIAVKRVKNTPVGIAIAGQILAKALAFPFSTARLPICSPPTSRHLFFLPNLS